MASSYTVMALLIIALGSIGNVSILIHQMKRAYVMVSTIYIPNTLVSENPLVLCFIQSHMSLFQTYYMVSYFDTGYH